MKALGRNFLTFGFGSREATRLLKFGEALSLMLESGF
jgi:hypothetical protein